MTHPVLPSGLPRLVALPLLLAMLLTALSGCGPRSDSTPAIDSGNTTGNGSGVDAGTGGNGAGSSPPPLSSRLPDDPGALTVASRVWCPESMNSGNGFHRMSTLDELPADPIGDGENNCYMEAFDTSVFSTDNAPIQGCDNLDLGRFPGHDCREAGNADQLKQAINDADKRVIILTADIEIGAGQLPHARRNQQSVWIIGRYDEATRRPVLLTQADGETSTIFNWSPDVPEWSFTVINLRMHTEGLNFSLGRKQTRGTTTLQSVTGKSGYRFMIVSFETPVHGPGGNDDPVTSIDDLTPWPIDDRLYMRNIMARGGSSHSIYADRAYLNWVEESIVLAAYASGKHAAKFEAQNVYLHNSVFTNTGIGNRPFDDPEWADRWFYKGPRHGNLAPLSLVSCSRVVLDHLTLYNHYDKKESNARAAQWQPRHHLGAGCDMPYGYYPNLTPTTQYTGPVDHQGQHYASSPFWTDAFWNDINDSDPLNDPGMITSFVTNSRVKQTDDGQIDPDNLYAVGTTGTYPVTKMGLFTPTFYFVDPVPVNWKERQRVVLNNNCFDEGLLPDHAAQNYISAGMEDPQNPGQHLHDNTDKTVLAGSQTCAGTTDGELDADVKAARDRFIGSLPQPSWVDWSR